MGLGLNGGGLASTRYFAKRGAQVTVTDLRLEEVLAPTLSELEGLDLRLVLGRHEEQDFLDADLVVKNPAVRADNPYLKLARRVETDLSLFLAALKNPVLAVTGSKGKSTTATALHALVSAQDPGGRIGGNIAVSPLSFLEDLEPSAPVVLELSSWQLADLRGRGVLRPKVAGVTNLLWDHMNSYPNQEAYAADKAVALEGVDSTGWALVNADQPWGNWFALRSAGRLALFSATGRPKGVAEARFWLEAGEGWGEWPGIDGAFHRQRLVPAQLLVPGAPFRQNCLMAAALAVLYGVDAALVAPTLATFGGVEHRLERFHTWQGIDFYNDTTATIPEAAAASVAAFSQPVHWIGGGTDKNLDLAAYETMPRPASISLLRGSATDRMLPVLKARGWSWKGPFGSLDEALNSALEGAEVGSVVLMSPGAASFELFRNEFDRGHTFKNLVRSRAR
jgi:UDP-N-acetylmuramoylalanine--D-glutamate ligase